MRQYATQSMERIYQVAWMLFSKNDPFYLLFREVDLLNCLSMVAILDFCAIFKIVALLKYANISIETNYAISRLKSMKNMKLVHLNIINKSESSFLLSGGHFEFGGHLGKKLKWPHI